MIYHTCTALRLYQRRAHKRKRLIEQLPEPVLLLAWYDAQPHVHARMLQQRMQHARVLRTRRRVLRAVHQHRARRPALASKQLRKQPHGVLRQRGARLRVLARPRRHLDLDLALASASSSAHRRSESDARARQCSSQETRPAGGHYTRGRGMRGFDGRPGVVEPGAR
ncbi:hypothetical protein FA95DRAFT_917046 [Auriscalpium vulgare]|uniref:Uncharacterized protein n=1 Tax=Auriscalpium vulgare TaxID=40419 RepID=A0ACB8R8A6_9AGAM|nr:hypothetical protein FA95DRAFT_917046 [Auriscalpium vulgare]